MSSGLCCKWRMDYPYTGKMVSTWLATLLSLSHLTLAANRCLQDVPEVFPKKFLKVDDYNYDFQRLPITIDVSRRATHQITSYIVKIFLEEELGYPDVVLREHSDHYSADDRARERLNGETEESVRLPESIINTEVLASPENEVISWIDRHTVGQCGAMGPPGRYGWFIPKNLLRNISAPAYWQTFALRETATLFSLTQQETDYLQNFTKDSSEGKYFCEEKFCEGGVYTPAVCESQECAVLLAGYADETGWVVEHVERLSLLVRVVWVGRHLSEVVNTLTSRLTRSPQPRALVFLSFTPSAEVLPHDTAYAAVAFPPCEQFGGPCKYDLHTLLKMHASVLERAAAPAYEAYLKMSLSAEDYRALLEEYRGLLRTLDTSSAAETAACGWLRSNPRLRATWSFNQETSRGVLFIGGIFPLSPVNQVNYNAMSIVYAAHSAEIAVNANNSVLPNYNVEVLKDDGRCEADAVLKEFVDYIMNQKYKKLVGILGPACSNTLEPLAGISTHYNTIVISYSAEGSSFSDRNKYPYFFRTIGENNQYKPVYLRLLERLGWRRLAALTEDGQKYTEYLAKLQDLLTSHNFTFVINRKFPPDRDKNAMRTYLEEMRSKQVRIIIGDVYDAVARDMMCQAYHLRMTAYESYVWFLPAWLSRDWYDTDKHNDSYTPCTTHQMIQAINGHLSLTQAAWAPDSAVMQTGQTVGQWRGNFTRLLREKRFDESSVSSYAGYAYDAVWMFALALDKLSKEDPSALTFIHAPNTTRRFVEILEKTDFDGVSGKIQFRGNPSRTSVIEVRQWLDGVSHVVGVFEPDVTALNTNPLAGTLHLNESQLVWLNPEGQKPNDGTRPCFMGIAELFGVEDCAVFLVVANVVVFCALAVLIILGLLYIKHRYDRKVKLTQQIMSSIGLDLLNVGTLEKWEIPRDKVVINRKLGEGAFGLVYGGETYFDSKGWVAVAVKTLKVGSTPEERLEFLCEAEVMKRFDHKNIVKLLGVCTKSEPVYTVMEFMLYGDLKTFLLARRHLVNERVGEECEEISSKKLTAMALDVARALSYLAELKFVHRDVASRNCLVNAARVVKLGDFGMTRPMFDKDYYKFSRKGMLPVRWMSPEALGLGMFTPASDVWSFGVLLFEIITFGSFPFQGMTNNQVLEHVRVGNTLTIPTGVRPQAEALIRSCWCLDYKKRPKASEIVEYMATHPRLIQPCLEVPLASVQTDDSASDHLLPALRHRKRNFSSDFSSSPQCNGVNNPPPWHKDDPYVEHQESLVPLGEETVPEWNRPLLNSSDKYVFVQPANTKNVSSFDPLQAESLL